MDLLAAAPQLAVKILLALFALACAPAAQGNVLVIVADDVARVDVEIVSAAGWTPSLDLLTEQGVSFTRAFANPVCTPGRESLLFGRWSVQGYGDCDDTGPQAASLAEFWEGPTAIFGKWHLAGPGGASAAQEQGFNVWRAGGCTSIEYVYPGSFHTTWTRYDDGVASESPGYPPQEIVDATIDWLAQMESETEPWLAIVGFPLAHQPFHVPPSSMLPQGYPTPPTSPPFAKRRGQYEAMIAALDFGIGILLEKVDLKETTVIFIGDNGTPALATPGGNKSKGTTYERGVNVPLIIAGLGVDEPGRVSSILVHAVDVFATINGSGPDGLSLEGVLSNTDLAPIREYVLCGFAGDHAARSAQYKLRRVGTVEQFFDLDVDPEETVNLISDTGKQGVIAEHRNWLDANLP